MGDSASRSRNRNRNRLVGWVAVLALALSSPAWAERRDDYDPQESGHPVKIAYYVLYPIGFVFDVLILRPAYWLGQHEPFRTVFGVDAARSSDAGMSSGPPIPDARAQAELETD